MSDLACWRKPMTERRLIGRALPTCRVKSLAFWQLLGDYVLCKAFGGAFSLQTSGAVIDLRRLTDMLMCSYTSARTTGSAARGGWCQEVWTADFKRVPDEGGWEFRLH